MKPIVVSLVFALLLSGCKKAIEEKQKDLVIQAMINGQWIITNFVHNGTTKTDDSMAISFNTIAIRLLMPSRSGWWKRQEPGMAMLLT
jgi:hypothetical protein